MTKQAYITIDDSPSPNTAKLCSYLAENDMPAILFCRGDMLERYSDAATEAIQKGMVLANHNFSHRPAGDLSFEETTEEIEKTELLIDAVYKQAGKTREGKYFRFPYIDRGNGDRLERRFGDITAQPDKPLPRDEKVQRIQDYLKREGFSQPFTDIKHPLYQNADVKSAYDCLFTYSSCDWMLTERHAGQWQYKSINDLKQKIDDDEWLCSGDGPQVLLFHDQPELDDVVIELLSYMKAHNFDFLPTA